MRVDGRSQVAVSRNVRVVGRRPWPCLVVVEAGGRGRRRFRRVLG
jgi:hypothetical protein